MSRLMGVASIVLGVLLIVILAAAAHMFRYEPLTNSRGAPLFWDRWEHRLCYPEDEVLTCIEEPQPESPSSEGLRLERLRELTDSIGRDTARSGD